MTPPPRRLVLTCEHAGNDVPPAYAALFDSPEAREALDSHRGWDPGSLAVGRAMAEVLDAPLLVQRVTRLLVECNRSLDHPRLFSEFSRRLAPDERREAVDRFWRPHRERVREAVIWGADAGGARYATSGVGTNQTADERVVHVGIHTFTPVWEGRKRETDIGLLYDPGRAGERDLVRSWRREMRRAPADEPLRVHLNRPYRGWTDGLITALRRELPDSRYVGIELEVSQRFAPVAGSLGRLVAEALQAALRARA